jgi:hypothetical protein
MVPQISSVLLSTAFFGPVYYFRSAILANRIFIEKHEHFIKQTYRNRCIILAANGPLALVVPVEKGRRPGQMITDIRIAYHTPWQRNHWRSISSAYRNSPYFDYYADELLHFFEKKYTFLFDYNVEITKTVTELIGANINLNYTPGFEQIEKSVVNFREQISPKIILDSFDPEYKAIPYTQVFEDKFQFVPNLSILDLLFCTGPESLHYLR